MADATTWGVSVDDVSALAPHIAITNSEVVPGNPAPIADPYNATSIRKITSAQVAAFIEDVAGQVDVRLFGRSRVTDELFKARIEASMQDIITNGAASYLVAAAFPMKSGVNENTSYSAELWKRHKEALDALDAAMTAFLKAGVGVEPLPTVPGGRITGYFPPVTFGDGMRW